MRKVFAVVVLLFWLSVPIVYAQHFQWIKGGGCTDDFTTSGAADPHEGAYMMTIDQHGNVYALSVVARYNVRADTFRGYCGRSQPNLLLTSYKPSGQMRWAKLILSDAGASHMQGLTCDSIGHIYISGLFINANLYIGSDTIIRSLPYQNLGVMQFDTNGHFKWVRYLGNNTYATMAAVLNVGAALVTDSSNNVHWVTNVKFGMPLSSTEVSHWGAYEFTFSSSGTLLSHKELAIDTSLSVTGGNIDRKTGKLYVWGELMYVVAGRSGYRYLAALDTGRNLIWIDTMGGYGVWTGVQPDGHGNLYLLAGGQTLMYFHGDTASGGTMGWFLKSDTAGNILWNRTFHGSTSINSILNLVLTKNGNLTAAGCAIGTVTTPGYSMAMYSGEGWNPYLVVIDTMGTVETFKQIHGSGGYDAGDCMTADNMGNIYMGGEVFDSIWVDSVGYHSVGGTSDFFVTRYGVDYDCTSMPGSSFTYSASGAGGSVVAFTYTGTLAGTDSIVWDFADGGRSASLYPTHTFTAAGTYTVCATVYSRCGNDIYCLPIYVPCVAAPTASFTTSGVSGTRTFRYTGVTFGLDSVVWHYGDGSSSVGTTTTHAYTTTSTYTACVTAYSPCGSDSACTTIIITCTAPPTATFSSSGTSATRGFTYTGTTTGVDSVSWRFGDGGRANGTTTAHTYAATGVFNVCCIAYSVCGNDTTCTNITVTCTTTPTASFAHSGVYNVSFTHTGSGTGIDSIVWHYGDGVTDTGVAPSHTYTSVGSFVVCEYVYNGCGVDSQCITITVPCITAPTAAFTDSVGHGGYVHFTFIGTGTGIDSVVWHYGDGATGRGISANHTYTGADTFTACMYVYSPCGIDSICHRVTVPCDTPVVSFTHTGIVHDTFTYTGSTYGLDSVVWDFGDGTRSTGTTTYHAYDTTGTYRVCITAYSFCTSDSICIDVHAIGLGIETAVLCNIQIFPNPASDEISIVNAPVGAEYKLMSVTGVTLIEGVTDAQSAVLNVTKISSGLYLLEVTAQNKREITKIVVER